jgi:hypothetical protein
MSQSPIVVSLYSPCPLGKQLDIGYARPFTYNGSVFHSIVGYCVFLKTGVAAYKSHTGPVPIREAAQLNYSTVVGVNDLDDVIKASIQSNSHLVSELIANKHRVIEYKVLLASGEEIEVSEQPYGWYIAALRRVIDSL